MKHEEKVGNLSIHWTHCTRLCVSVCVCVSGRTEASPICRDMSLVGHRELMMRGPEF